MRAASQPLLAAVARALRELASGLPGRPLLAAVSGGADSLALLLALRRSLPPTRPLVALHLHHGIRGRAADADAAFVRARCAALGVPLLEQRGDAPALARRDGLSLEMAARQLRYAFFRDALRRTGGLAVATAHTADDQAETVLLKLLRGAGPRGLGGIAARGVALGVPVIRPLLAVSRPAVELFLRAAGETWREDRTNRDTRLLRNRVRHELLPLLERRFNPRIRALLVRTAAVLQDEEAWLEPGVRRAAARVRAAAGGVDGAALAALAPALRRRVLRAWLLDGGYPETALGYDRLCRLEALVGVRTGSRAVPLGAGYRAVSEYGRWRLEGPGAALPPPARRRAAIRLPGVTDLPAWGLRVTVAPSRGFRKTAPPGLGRLPCRAWIDARVSAAGGLQIRSRRPGDRMRLPAGSRKVQDLLTDAKLPRAARDSVPLFVCGASLVWIPGGPVAVPWRVADARARSWEISVGPHDFKAAGIALPEPAV